MSVYERLIKSIKKRRYKIAAGKINTIPIGLNKMTKFGMPGLEQGTYYLVTAQAKAAKTQITSYLFLFSPILYAMENDIDLKIYYVPLEETPEKVMARFFSYLLYTKFNRTVDYRTLMSSNNIALSTEIFDIISGEGFQKYAEAFEKYVVFIDDTKNHNDIVKYVTEELEKEGEQVYKEVPSVDVFGATSVKKIPYYFKPNNEDAFRFLIIDHISLIDAKGGLGLKSAIDDFSIRLVRMRNKYGISPVIVQQQNDNDNDAMQNKQAMKPSLNNLRDSKNPGKDCQICIGIYSPMRYGVENHYGYDIKRLKDNYRMVEFLASRDGEAGASFPLRFEGACSFFSELPKPDSLDMEVEYLDIERNRANRFKKKTEEQQRIDFEVKESKEDSLPF